MKTQNLAQYLRQRSEEICRDNGCTDEQHNCESYAYINQNMQLIDICACDFFCGSSEPYAAIALPWIGTMTQLESEVEEQIAESRID